MTPDPITAPMTSSAPSTLPAGLAPLATVLDHHGPISAGGIVERTRAEHGGALLDRDALETALAELGRLGHAVRVGGKRWRLTARGRRALEARHARSAATATAHERNELAVPQEAGESQGGAS